MIPRIPPPGFANAAMRPSIKAPNALGGHVSPGEQVRNAEHSSQAGVILEDGVEVLSRDA